MLRIVKLPAMLERGMPRTKLVCSLFRFRKEMIFKQKKLLKPSLVSGIFFKREDADKGKTQTILLK